jgi:hypothetical protein
MYRGKERQGYAEKGVEYISLPYPAQTVSGSFHGVTILGDELEETAAGITTRVRAFPLMP